MMYAYCVKLGRLSLAEHTEATGVHDLILYFYSEDLVAIIELKFGKSKDGDQDKFLADLAQKALKAINVKEYGASFLSGGRMTVKIGVGVTTRGKCLGLIGDFNASENVY
jgi:hypothetical protein